MATRIRVIDDHHAVPPFTLTRPAIDLRVGGLRLWEKVAIARNERVGLEVADSWAPVLRERDPSLAVNPDEPLLADTVFVNGRLRNADQLARVLAEHFGDLALFVGDTFAGARLRPERAAPVVAAIRAGQRVDPSLLPVPRRDWTGDLIATPWDIVAVNAEEIADDFQRLGGARHVGSVHPSAVLYRPDAIRIDQDAVVEALAVLDARHGPIWIGPGAIVHPMTYIQGPAAIGPAAQVMSGARIREAVALGVGCRVGGEVEASVFQGLSNKYHDGFVGHSVIGWWCNLGALTTTSDLKNTYGSVRVTIDGQPIDTGRAKIGSFIGDHTKLGIGTLLTSGAILGVACNLYGGELLPPAIPSFSWGTARHREGYDIDRFLQTAAIVMSRRKQTLGPAEIALFRRLAALRATTTA